MPLKRILMILLFVNFSCSNLSKEFEGTIVYSISISNSNPNVKTELLEEMYGKKQVFYYKEGYFKWELDTTTPLTTYNPIENINYLQFRPDSLYLQRGSTIVEKITTLSFLKKEKILDYSCNGLYFESNPVDTTLLFKQRKRVYFYNSNFPVDPLHFVNCNFNNLNEVYSKIKAIPLKIVEDFDGLKITYTAISIEQRSIDKNTFKIYPNLPKRIIN